MRWQIIFPALCVALAFSLPVPPALGPGARAQTKVVPPSVEAMELSFAPVVKAVAPAVVNIFSKRVVQQRTLPPLLSDPFFQHFFGDNFGGFGLPRERIENSLGSGVIVSPEGLIVTNHHVVEGATEITAVLADRREFPATLVLDDERTDLAVLRIDNGHADLPHVEFRNSDSIEVGDLVLAIGDPFGVGQTVTSGIISATARTQVGISDYAFFIQTDAAINPGNSGGALVTLDGKLVGINTAIFSRSGGSIGIGFAIPSNMVRTVVASAERGGEVVRPWTGLIGQSLTPDLAEAFGLTRPGGVVVNKVYPGGPAARAGIAPRDVILSVDGQAVEDVESFRFRVATGELGRSVSLEIWRDGKTLKVILPLERAPETPPRDERQLDGKHPLVGAVVVNLSPAVAEELDRPGEWQGVIVLKIVRGSPAHRLGFAPGDVLLKVNDYQVVDVAGLDAELARPATRWRVSFIREGRVRSAEFNL